MTLPKAICFDLDDTLIEAYGNPRDAWNAVLKDNADALAGIKIDELSDTIGDVTRRFWKDERLSQIWRADIIGARREIMRLARFEFEKKAAKTFDELIGREIADQFSAYRDANLRINDSAIPVLAKLTELGIRLGVITNGTSVVQRAKMDRFGLTKFSHLVQIEGEVGVGKPDLEAYRCALNHLRLAATDVWMVGDNLEWDVLAPQRLGITGIWFNPNNIPFTLNPPIPDRTIASLSLVVPLAE